MFNHVECDLPALSRKTIDGVRYYSVDDRPMYPSLLLHHIGIERFLKTGEQESVRRKQTESPREQLIVVQKLMN